MPPRQRNTEDKADRKAVKVGDTIELDGNPIAVLPDGTAVTTRARYTIEQEGLHVIDGVEYMASAK